MVSCAPLLIQYSPPRPYLSGLQYNCSIASFAHDPRACPRVSSREVAGSCKRDEARAALPSCTGSCSTRKQPPPLFSTPLHARPSSRSSPRHHHRQINQRSTFSSIVVLLWRFGRLRRSGGGRRGGSYRALLDRDCVIRRTLCLELQVLHTGYHGLVPLGSTIQVRHQCCR